MNAFNIGGKTVSMEQIEADRWAHLIADKTRLNCEITGAFFTPGGRVWDDGRVAIDTVTVTFEVKQQKHFGTKLKKNFPIKGEKSARSMALLKSLDDAVGAPVQTGNVDITDTNALEAALLNKKVNIEVQLYSMKNEATGETNKGNTPAVFRKAIEAAKAAPTPAPSPEPEFAPPPAFDLNDDFGDDAIPF